MSTSVDQWLRRKVPSDDIQPKTRFNSGVRQFLTFLGGRRRDSSSVSYSQTGLIEDWQTDIVTDRLAETQTNTTRTHTQTQTNTTRTHTQTHTHTDAYTHMYTQTHTHKCIHFIDV